MQEDGAPGAWERNAKDGDGYRDADGLGETDGGDERAGQRRARQSRGSMETASRHNGRQSHEYESGEPEMLIEQ